MWAIWASLSRLSLNICQVRNSSLNTTVALLGLAGEFVLSSQDELYRNQAWADGSWETKVLGMPFLLICFGFVVCFFGRRKPVKGQWICPDGSLPVALPGMEGAERWRRHEVVQVEWGRSRAQFKGRIVVFPLQSLHAQDARDRIQAVIRYEKVKILKGGMAQGTPNQHR